MMEVRTADGAMALANYVHDPRYRQPRKHTDVYLPYSIDAADKFYFYYLLEHPHPLITCHYTERELWKR